MTNKDFVSRAEYNALLQRVEKLEKEIHLTPEKKISTKDVYTPHYVATDSALTRGVKDAEAKIKKSFAERFKTEKGATWELFLGGNIFAKLGMLALILTAAWFIKMAFDKRWVNESGRIFIGLIAGFSFIAAAIYLAKQKIKILPAAILGTGFAIVYIAIYGGYYYYSLFTLQETFVYVVALSIVLAVLSRLVKLESLLFFGLIGAFLAPIVLSQGENSYRFLFSYLTFINILFYLLSRNHLWRFTFSAALLSNYLIFSVWMADKLSISSFPAPFLYLLSTFILYGTLLWFHYPIIRGAFSTWAYFAQFTQNIFFFVLGYALFEQFYPNAIFLFFFIHLAFLLLIIFVVEKYVRAASSKEFFPESWQRIQVPHFSILFALFAGAIFNFTDGQYLHAMLLVFTGALSLLGSLSGRKIFIFLSLPLWFITLILLYFSWHFTEPEIPLIGQRFLFYLIATLLLSGTVFFSIDRRKNPDSKIPFYLKLFAWAAVGSLLIGSFYEVRSFISGYQWRNLGYTTVMGIYALLFLAFGLIKNTYALRLAGVVVMALALAKFYLHDIWYLNLLVRIFAGLILGIALLIFSLFYQKFRDKILNLKGNEMNPLNPSNKTNLTILFFIIGLFVFHQTPAQAQSARINSFPFYKEISMLDGNKPNGTFYGKVALDREIYQKSDPYRLRLFSGQAEIAYTIRNIAQPANLYGKTQPTVVFQDKKKNQWIYVLKLADIPAGSDYESLSITKNGEYDVRLIVEYADQPGQWKYSGQRSIHRYKESADKSILINPDKSRYVRLTINSHQPFQFPSANFSPTRKNREFSFNVPLAEIKQSKNIDQNYSEYYYQNEYRRNLSRLELKFADANYSRNVQIYHLVNKSYVHLIDTKIIKQADQNKTESSHFIDITRQTNQPLKLIIENGDNPPLTLQNFTVFTPMEEIVFRLNSDRINQPLRIYYGNPYIHRPRYDFAETLPKDIPLIVLKAKMETGNKDFSYSFIEPPMSQWILRIVFILGIIGLTWPTVKFFRKYSLSQ